MVKLNIDRDEIKEKLNVLRIYLTICLATTTTGIVWLSQNIDVFSTNSFRMVFFLTITTISSSFLIEQKIHKLIN